MDYTAISKRIADTFPSLSPQLQVAARHVLDRPDDVALMSMRSLAGAAGVHPSTMVRLARSFGYDSYQDFRAPFQHRLRGRPEGYLARARDLQVLGQEGEAALTQEVLSANLDNLRETFDINTPERFEDCAQTLAGARKLYIIGLRGVFPVAYFFHYAYSMFRNNAVLLDGRGGVFADDLRHFGPKDVIFAVSFEPYTVETVRAVDFAREQGGKSVVLTDSMVSPLVRGSDQMLIIKNESPSFYHSVAAAVTAAEELITLLMAEGGDSALKAIEESERQLDQIHAYWQRRSKKRKSSKRDRSDT